MGFLFDHGWIIIVIGLGAAYLYQTGDPLVEQKLSASCMGFDALTYVAHDLAKDGTFSITLKNQGIEEFTITRIIVRWGELDWNWEGPKTIGIGDNKEIAFGGVKLSTRPNDSYRIEVLVQYTQGGLMEKSEKATCVGDIS